MAGLPPDGTDETTGTPRWVKVFGAIAAVVLLLFVILLVFGGGEHGPRRHGGTPGRDLSAVTVIYTPPPGLLFETAQVARHA